MFRYGFMLNAYEAASVVAVLAGCVGWFLLLRGEAFAGHALAHVGFTGATGAVLLGLSPLPGLICVTVLGGVAMGLMGARRAGRDVAIGMVLALALGLGLLFLHFYTSYATEATALLFGNVLGVERRTVAELAVLAAGSLLALALMARRLIFASALPELAEARGISPRLLSVAFLSVVALATAAATQIIGVLLVFTLLVGPAAAAQRLATNVGAGVLLAVAFALVQCWAGLAAAFYTDWPTSFWITALSGATYAAAAGWAARSRHATQFA